MKIEDLVGETLAYIDADDQGEEVMLTTQSGRRIRIFHNQDCCETVRVEDTQGNWHDLIGRVIIEATEDVRPQGDPPPEYPDSWTRTTLTFKVDGATVISKWIGESNGYYSESVDIEELSRHSANAGEPSENGSEV